MAKFHYQQSPSLNQKKSFAPYLSEDEELVLVTGLSKASIRSKFLLYFLFPGIILGALGFGFALMIGLDKITGLVIGLTIMLLLAILKTFHTYHANRYLLTTRRVIIKKGLFSVKLTAAMYDKITHIEVDQSFVDRVFLHHGSIIISTAGLSKNEIVLQFVDYPLELKNLMERLINREREQYGIRGTSLSEVEGEIIS